MPQRNHTAELNSVSLPMAIEDLRQLYAQTIGKTAKVRTEGLVRALAIVPREQGLIRSTW